MADPLLGKDTSEHETGTPLRSCPVCVKPAAYATRPFCSKRCADIDLHRWLKGSYAIPASGEVEADAAENRGERPGAAGAPEEG